LVCCVRHWAGRALKQQATDILGNLKSGSIQKPVARDPVRLSTDRGFAMESWPYWDLVAMIVVPIVVAIISSLPAWVELWTKRRK
jgi:hypothetical protein